MNANFMRLWPQAVLLSAILLMPAIAVADPETDRLRAENADLKAENASLRAQLNALKAQAPSTTSAAAMPSVDATVVRQGALAPAVPGHSQAAPAALPASPAQAQTPPAAAAQAVAVPAGYKLVPASSQEPADPLAPPYDKTGCSLGLFKGPPPAKWNNADNWFGMGLGLSMTEVEGMLGREHFDANGRGRVEWQYGKCGESVSARVVFKDGKVVLWQAPSL